MVGRSVFIVAFLLNGWGAAADAQTGTLVFDTVHAPSLEGNLLGDPADRPVVVYLPPGYAQSSNRYPVLYLLHGYADAPRVWLRGGYRGFALGPSLDSLIVDGTIAPLLVVAPDAHNAYFGSFYVNSEVTGRWEDFIVRDLVEHVDRNYRTIPARSSRGIAGHSMGGYGAIMLGMKHADVFSAVYAMSPCCLGFRGDLGIENPSWDTVLALDRRNELMLERGLYVNVIMALSAAFSPDRHAPPFFVKFPFERKGERLAPAVCSPAGCAHGRWLAHFPLDVVDSHRASLATLEGLRFDVGTSEQFSHILIGSRELSERMEELGIPHVFEEYDGDHRNRIGTRMKTKVLPFFSETIGGGRSKRFP